MLTHCRTPLCISAHHTALLLPAICYKPRNTFFFFFFCLSSDVSELSEFSSLTRFQHFSFLPATLRLRTAPWVLEGPSQMQTACCVHTVKAWSWHTCRQSRSLATAQPTLVFLTGIQVDKLPAIHLQDVKLMKVGQKPLKFACWHNLTVNNAVVTGMQLCRCSQYVCMLHLL